MKVNKQLFLFLFSLSNVSTVFYIYPIILDYMINNYNRNEDDYYSITIFGLVIGV